MLSPLWLALVIVTTIPFVVRGVVMIALFRRAFGLLATRMPVNGSFCAFATTIVLMGIFPPLHGAGDWIVTESGQTTSSLESYWLDKSYFGLIIYYRFPGLNHSGEPLNGKYRPLQSPWYSVTRKSHSIDFPIQFGEIALLGLYVLLPNRYGRTLNCSERIKY